MVLAGVFAAAAGEGFSLNSRGTQDRSCATERAMLLWIN